MVDATGLDYVAFAFNATHVVVGYEAWCAAALAVIAEKTARDTNQSSGVKPEAS
jgi:hypothetical protein